jgi:glycerol-3-phosphate dehydrogenase
MERSLEALAERSHDLLIVGGGIAGAWMAWEASLAGLKVALVDKGDFCGATSANSSTILHGGLRYLQQADLTRMRKSIQERRVLLSVAPHLTRPLPCAIPTYKGLKHGRATLGAGLLLADVIGFNRNYGLPAGRRLKAGRLLNREVLSDAVPGVECGGVTGGALWYDGQVTAPGRLVLAILQGASKEGAALANYVEAIAPTSVATQSGRQVTGLEVHDRRTGQQFSVEARMVVDATGPWAGHLASRVPGIDERHCPPLCGGMNLVVRRPGLDRGTFDQAAWGGRMATGDGGSRFLFAVPSGDSLFFGTRYFEHQGPPDSLTVSEQDVGCLLQWINETFPTLRLQRREVIHVHAGLLPAEPYAGSSAEPVPLRHHQIIEHQKEDGVLGLMTVVTEKLTTARSVGVEVVGRVLSLLGRAGPTGRSAERSVWGGDMEDVERFLEQAVACPMFSNVSRETARGFATHYGSEFGRVLEYLPPATLQPDEGDLLSAGAAFALRHEMAQTLSDVALRRVYQSGGGVPADKALEILARRMGRERCWDEERVAAEVAAMDTATYSEKEQ